MSLLALLLLMEWFLPHYWEMKPTALSSSITQGKTKEGNPWIGAENPALTIEEFSDYQCFQCRKMHFFLRKLVQLYPNHIRLVHRHFPMDRKYNPMVTDNFHGGSGKMAIIALYAAPKGQFWAVNDLLFNIASQKRDFNTKTIEDFMGVPRGELANALNDRYLRLRLKHDIALGIEKGIKGTPSFSIDGHLYLGTIPKHVLEKIDNWNKS
jgi:protein-disulfide isomerase